MNEILWEDSWALVRRYYDESGKFDLDEAPQDLRLAWGADWSLRALWCCRTVLDLTDPILDHRLFQHRDSLVPIVHDWGAHHRPLVRRGLEGRALFALTGEPTGRLAFEICEGLALSARALRGPDGKPHATGVGAALELDLVWIMVAWIGRLDFFERPNRAALYQAIAPLLVPGTVPERILAIRFALATQGVLPPERDLLDLWDAALPDPSAPETGLILGESVPWGLFVQVLQAVHTAMKVQRRSQVLGSRLARLDDAIARWKLPPGAVLTPLGIGPITLLFRADSALLGGRTAEFAALRPRLEGLLSLPGGPWPSSAAKLLKGAPLFIDEP